MNKIECRLFDRLALIQLLVYDHYVWMKSVWNTIGFGNNRKSNWTFVNHLTRRNQRSRRDFLFTPFMSSADEHTD